MGNFGIKVNCINPERTKNSENKNFGNEPEASLLKPEMVALRSIQTLVSGYRSSHRCSIVKNRIGTKL
jgi:2-C-methyl-D-erythritol 4-phosphate cytidylyltransferase